jgi:superfamily II DNA/RNA helicase
MYKNRKSYGNKYIHQPKNGNRGFKTWARHDLIKVVNESKLVQEKIHEDVFTPINSFDTFAICQQLKQNIHFKNYKEPTPIQDQAIPYILQGQDLIGIANTGTGKTAAFLIPTIEKCVRNRKERVLIITPTRELAEQIDEEFRYFARNLNIRSALCIGGANMIRQTRDIRYDPAFIIGTPGRIKDLIKRNILDISKFSTVILDETDRMVDIGFIDEIKFFISLLSAKRQSLFFSATISPKVTEILKQFVHNPVTVSVKKQEVATSVTQDLIYLKDGQAKIDKLTNLLKEKEFEKVLIFGRTKWGVQKLADELVRRGHRAEAIHGDKRQNKRTFILNQFKRNEIRILLATDVASRGLDIKDVSHVINYDIPESYEAYIHRIGRTGRADKKGVALTFVD